MNDVPKHTHEWFMDECIELAQIAKRRGDSPVGSVVVRNGAIIGSGIEGGKTRRDITFHAEIEAIREATTCLNSQDLSGCIMYTTHEPCIMCSYVIRHTKISVVVMGSRVQSIGGYSSKFPVLTDGTIPVWGDPPTIVEGIRTEACAALK